MKAPIAIIDCNYLGYRALFTTGPLAYKGRPTGVIYGFLSQLYTIAEALRPSNVVFCWDSRKSHRRRKFPFYKSRNNKEEGPDQDLLDAFEQFKQLRKEILPQLGFTNIFMQAGYEADDLIARFVMDHPQEGIICSSDEDLLQLLNYAPVYNLGKKKRVTAQDFTAQYQIPPEKWVEVKKLAGCSGDNVPGIRGIGEKTAARYLAGALKRDSKKYASIQSASEELLAQNDWLVRLPLPGTKSMEVKNSEFNQRELERLCRELAFVRLPGLTDWDIFFGR